MFRAALSLVLGGQVYHMMTVAMERPDHHRLWRKALAGTITKWAVKSRVFWSIFLTEI